MAQAAPKPRAGKSRATTTATKRAAPARGGPQPDLRIVETRILRGPNYWAREPVVRMVVDLGSLEEFPSNKIPGFTDALVNLLPSLEDHACSLGRRGGFITRLKEGTWAGHIAEHIALELQNLAGTNVRHGKTRGYGRVRPLQRHLRVPRGGGRHRGRQDRSCARQPPRRAERPGPRARPHGGAGAAHPPRRAPGLRPEHAGDPRRGREPRHPVHPPRPPLAGPARPGRPPAADPGDDDLADEWHRRRHRLGQEPHEPPPRLGRPAGPEERRRRDGGPGRRRREPHRLPVRRQAARRQPRPRRPARPPRRGRGPHGVPAGRSPRAGPATSSSRATSPATTIAAS